MLPPGPTVTPQQSVALRRNLACLELDRVLAVQLLGVHELTDHRQDPDAIVEPVEPVKCRHGSGHHSHLSQKAVTCEEHPEKDSEQSPGAREKKSLVSVT